MPPLTPAAATVWPAAVTGLRSGPPRWHRSMPGRTGTAAATVNPVVCGACNGFVCRQQGSCADRCVLRVAAHLAQVGLLVEQLADLQTHKCTKGDS